MSSAAASDSARAGAGAGLEAGISLGIYEKALRSGPLAVSGSRVDGEAWRTFLDQVPRAGFSFLDIMPKPGQQIVITMEPAGGSAQPTTPPLVTLRVSEDAGRSGAATGSPSPASSAGPTGDSA